MIAAVGCKQEWELSEYLSERETVMGDPPEFDSRMADTVRISTELL
jgi:hypothetical protein